MGDGRWYRRWGDGIGVPRQDDRLFAEWQVLVFAYLEELIDRQDAVMIYIIPRYGTMTVLLLITA